MKTLSSTSSETLCLLLVLSPGGEISWAWRLRPVQRTHAHPSDTAKTRARCPDSSTWETQSPALPLSAGAPSSELSAEIDDLGPTGQTGQNREGDDGGLTLEDVKPQDVLTH